MWVFSALQEENKQSLLSFQTPINKHLEKPSRATPGWQGMFLSECEVCKTWRKSQRQELSYVGKARHHKILYVVCLCIMETETPLQEIRYEHRKTGNTPFSLRAFGRLPIISIQGWNVLLMKYLKGKAALGFFLFRKSPQIKPVYVFLVAMWGLLFVCFSLLICGITFQGFTQLMFLLAGIWH